MFSIAMSHATVKTFKSVFNSNSSVKRVLQALLHSFRNMNDQQP